MKQITIAGAGLAGLLAGCKFPTARIQDVMPEPTERHKALLRFRDDSVSRLTGIDFKKVRVHKGIWDGEEFVQPNIQICNSYAKKVLGQISPRSIWNLDPVDRYIAPDDFYWQLIDRMGNRIEFDASVDYTTGNPVISTAPMHVVLSEVGIYTPHQFDRAPVTVQRYKVDRCNVYQTVYFPNGVDGVYRASITGDTLIVEGVNGIDASDMANVLLAFWLSHDQLTPLGAVEQKYGKIVSLPDAERKRLLFQLTHKHNIFSVGRFATWRNILLDDVADDLDKVKQLLAASEYDLRNFAK